MSAPSDYAPKRNPAADIVDLKPPAFLRRPQHPLNNDPSWARPADLPPVAEYVPEPEPPEPETPIEPTDRQWVAINLDKLRHLDLKAMIAEMFGDELPKDRSEIADKMAQWAASNNPRVAA